MSKDLGAPVPYGFGRDSVDLSKAHLKSKLRHTSESEAAAASSPPALPAVRESRVAESYLNDGVDVAPVPALRKSLQYRRPVVDPRLLAERHAFELAFANLPNGKLASGPPPLSFYTQSRLLGEGSFGRVVLVEEVRSKSLHALKLHSIKSRFLVAMSDSFQDAESIYFVLEICTGGELFDHMTQQPNNRFPSAIVQFFVGQVTLAFEYLHNLDISYRDLKPENLLLDYQGNLKITDLGFAKRFYDKTFTMCGTPEYMAPEIILNQGHNHAVDWWSLGVLTFELLNGCSPFVAKDEKTLFVNIITNKYKCGKHFTIGEIDFVDKLLQKDVTRRLGYTYGGVDVVKNHVYFKGLNWDALMAGTVDPPFKPKVSGPRDFSSLKPEEEPYRPLRWAEGHSSKRYGDVFADF